MTFEDHFSQATLFYRSLTPLEQDHVIASYTFELSKIYEQTIRERQLLALANIDADLCQQVAAGLGLEAPEPESGPVESEPSAALTQLGGTWPVAGRIVRHRPRPGQRPGRGRDAAHRVPGSRHRAAGDRTAGRHDQRADRAAQPTRTRRRSSSTRSSWSATPPPADDALPSLDAKSAAEGGPDTATDPRVLKLLGEAWRHAKAIGGLVDSPVLAGAGIPLDAPGVVVGDGAEVAAQLIELLAAHRAWDRFPGHHAGLIACGGPGRELGFANPPTVHGRQFWR